MHKATITDIAKELNLTPSTVSRALAGSNLVKQETREAVEAKAKAMGYERNIMASNLRKGVAKTVGIVVPRINRQFFSNVISGAETVLNSAGYTVLICQTIEKYETEVQAVNTLLKNQVAGIIISHSIETVNNDHLKKALDSNVRLVQFDRVFYNIPDVKVVNDNFHGAYIATKQLIDNGYKRIGTLAGYMTSAQYRERLEGYKRALMDAGLEIDDRLIFKNTIVRDTGYARAKEALDLGCDAMYSAGDFSALGAMQAAMERGLRIPDDFGIVGTANENFTALMTPSMSSLSLRAYDMGEAAANAFLNDDSDNPDSIITIEMELMKRDSSNRTNRNK
jgi:LacI family transcriptional regulator